MKDNSEERFPIVDEEGRVVGSATRGECHLEKNENEISDKNMPYGRGGNLRKQKKRIGAASAPFGTDLTDRKSVV